MIGMLLFGIYNLEFIWFLFLVIWIFLNFGFRLLMFAFYIFQNLIYRLIQLQITSIQFIFKCIDH